MSIPKEPRQLMINLMYLVLTAMLALNVSAEVMNAFFTLDKGNKESIATVENQLSATEKGLRELLNEEAKAKFKPIEPALDEVRSTISEFNNYIDDLRHELVDEGGNKNGEEDEGDYKMDHGKRVPIGKKNKDITTRLLVRQERGEELKAKILESREELINTYSTLLNEHGKTFGLKETDIENRIASMTQNLPLSIDDETWRESKDKSSWSDFKFRQMPLAAVLPLLSQMQSNAKSSEVALVTNLAELAGGKVIEFDAFFPVVEAEKAYVIAGEPFKANISVGTYSSQIPPENIRLSVNGQSLNVGDEGKAEFTASTSSVGQKQLNLKVAVTNPLTGETTEGESTFIYEVGRRSVAVSADKMNVFYIGVDNPISVAAAGISSNDLRVSASGGGATISKTGSTNYNVRVTSPGTATVRVTGGGLNDPFEFRVKRIPDPVAKIAGTTSGTMGNGEFKAQGGVIAELENFDFDARCDIAGFELIYAAPRQDPVPVTNPGPRFNSQARNLINQAKPGDVYYFNNVRAKCPGDQNSRQINPLLVRIR